MSIRKMSHIERSLRANLMVKLIKAGDKGKRETVLIYEGRRYHKLSEQYVKDVLKYMIEDGIVRAEDKRKRGYKTISEKEEKQVLTYYFVPPEQRRINQ